LAASGAPAGTADGGGAGAGALVSGGLQEILLRVYAMLVQNGMNVIGALVIFVVGRWGAKIVSSLLGKALTRAKVDPTLVPFIDNLAYTAMLGFVIIAALAEVGVQTASVVAVLGAAGLAIGLALQGSLANFASGVLLLVFKPFRVGDSVQISGVTGTVQAIHVFNTVLNDGDNVRIIVPNGQVTSGNILNYTINGTRRIDMTVSVSYDDDLKKARRVIESVLAADKRILPTPAPVVAVSEMGDSSMDLVVRPWVKTDDYWPVRFDLTEKLKETLDEHGLTMPFPTQEVYVRSDAAAASALKSA
jgi:small conductance mechanosensitive channel